MLKIIARNDDGIRLSFEFETPDAFINDMDNNEDCIGDNEILLVVMDNLVIYSSLGNKAKCYDDTLRSIDVYNWFKG